MMVHDDCKGCRLSVEQQIVAQCAYQDSYIAEHCPCLLCLTKPVCDKEDCDVRMHSYQVAIEGDKEHDHTMLQLFNGSDLPK